MNISKTEIDPNYVWIIEFKTKHDRLPQFSGVLETYYSVLKIMNNIELSNGLEYIVCKQINRTKKIN